MKVQCNVYIYIFLMAGVTYLIRMLPLTLIRREITNKYIKSFLYYVPYVTLAAMTFPEILTATSSKISAIIGFIVALVMAFCEKSLLVVAASSCIVVFLVERLLNYL